MQRPLVVFLGLDRLLDRIDDIFIGLDNAVSGLPSLVASLAQRTRQVATNVSFVAKFVVLLADPLEVGNVVVAGDRALAEVVIQLVERLAEVFNRLEVVLVGLDGSLGPGDSALL